MNFVGIVRREVQHGSVLGLYLCVLYINSMPRTISSDLYLFADDAKAFRQISSSEDA